MFDRSIGRFKINNEEIPIFYKDGKFFLSFRKLRNAVNDYAEKNCDRVLKRLNFNENKDYFRDVVKGGAQTQYFVTEETAISYLDSLIHLDEKVLQDHINTVENNILKYKSIKEKNKERIEDDDIDKSHSIDMLETSTSLYDDTEDCDSFVATVLTNLTISVDNIHQIQNEIKEKIINIEDGFEDIEEKLEFLNEEIKNIKSGNYSSEVQTDISRVNLKTTFDTLAVLCSSIAAWLSKNHQSKLTSLCYKQSNKCLKIASGIYDQMTQLEKENEDNQKVDLR